MNRSREFTWLVEELVVPEEEITLPGVTNGDSYLHIDDNVLCFAGKDGYDNIDIVEEMASKRTQLEESGHQGR